MAMRLWVGFRTGAGIKRESVRIGFSNFVADRNLHVKVKFHNVQKYDRIFALVRQIGNMGTMVKPTFKMSVN